MSTFSHRSMLILAASMIFFPNILAEAHADDLKAREQSLHSEREEAEKVLQMHNLELEKKVEQRTAAILAAQEQLSDFKDAIDEHSIVSMTDLDGTITFANDKFCDISGYSREELIGQNHRLLNSGNQDQNY